MTEIYSLYKYVIQKMCSRVYFFAAKNLFEHIKSSCPQFKKPLKILLQLKTQVRYTTDSSEASLPKTKTYKLNKISHQKQKFPHK